MSAGPFDQDVVEASVPAAEPEIAAVASPPIVRDQAGPGAEQPAEAADDGPDPTAWSGGGFMPYEVGDPGRAAREVVAPPPLNPSDPADTQIDAAAAGGLVIRAASVRGISHRHEGTPRQDEYAICTTDDGRWLVVGVADGVSAGSLSHQAATIACRAAGALVRDALVTDAPEAIPWAEVINAIAGRIVVHGRRVLGEDGSGEISPADVARAMATTLVVAVVATGPGDDGTHLGALLAIGDTSAFVFGADRTWRPVTSVKNDGATVASSATIALPYVPQDPLVAAPLTLAAGEALFVMTDGVGDPLGRGQGEVGDFLGEAWAEPPDPISFAGQVGFARRSYDDDRTTVGIWARA